MSSSNCCYLTCIQISQEAGKVVWYSLGAGKKKKKMGYVLEIAKKFVFRKCSLVAGRAWIGESRLVAEIVWEGVG